MVRSKSIVPVMALCAVAALAGCAAPSTSGHTYTTSEARRPMRVETGVIQAIREVRLERSPQTGTGTAAGAVVGGVAGSNIGRGKGAIIGSVLGAVAGGVVGWQCRRRKVFRARNAAARDSSRRPSPI